MRETSGIMPAGSMLLEISHADYDNRDFPGVKQPTWTDLEGVPLGKYDFGGEVGVVDVGTAAMILTRRGQTEFYKDTGIAPTVRIEVEALQVRTTVKKDLGFGFGHYYLTVDRSKPLLSTMVVIKRNQYGGVAHLSVNISFDVRCESVDGRVVFSGEGCFMSVGAPWSFRPQHNAVEIPRVNCMLNGSDASDDFWLAVVPDRVLVPTHIDLVAGWHGKITLCGARSEGGLHSGKRVPGLTAAAQHGVLLRS